MQNHNRNRNIRLQAAIHRQLLMADPRPPLKRKRNNTNRRNNNMLKKSENNVQRLTAAMSQLWRANRMLMAQQCREAAERRRKNALSAR